MGINGQYNFSLPHFMVGYKRSPGGITAKSTLVNTSGLAISASNYHGTIKLFENDGYFLCTVGHPILKNKIDPQGVWQAFLSDTVSPNFLRSLNGEFLLIYLNKSNNQLQVINDRFTAIPFYYVADSSGFVGSIFYNDLWKWLQSEKRLTLKEEVFFEFIWLQRILGSKTYDTFSHFLPAATSLTYDGQRAKLERYWTPSFQKTTQSVQECAAQLGELLKQSIRKKSSDQKSKVGLFLSGGTDSRTVLAAFDTPPVCFTVAMFKNNEYRVAHEVAKIKKAQHVFIQLDPDPYTKRIDALVQLGGGMYAFDHALFLGFEDIVAPLADVVFHGHGIDYMFQGMYVPRTRIRIGSKNTFFYKLRPLAQDLVSDFLTTIPYRLKGVDLLQFTKPSYRKRMYESLRASVEEILEQGATFCNTPNDFWEWTLTHALSRHYPNTNLSSMATCAEQRTVTFDNQVLDLYLSLPTKYRLHAKTARLTLKYLDAQMAKVRTGNTNIRADFTPLQTQLYRLWDMGLVRLGVRKRTEFWAPAEERTWPDRDRLIRSEPRMKEAALNVCDSEALASLNFLDMDVISRQIPRWLEQSSGGGSFMISLITLDRFLRQ